MKPLSLPVLAAVAVAAANFSAAPAQAAKFRICKNVSATGVHVHQASAIAIARGRYDARLRSHRRGGYSNSWSAGPHCVSRRNGFYCSFWTRMCKTR